MPKAVPGPGPQGGVRLGGREAEGPRLLGAGRGEGGGGGGQGGLHARLLSCGAASWWLYLPPASWCHSCYYY